MPINNAPASVNAEASVVAAVLEEISTLECSRPGLVAVALALAAVLEKLRTASTARRGNLALVRNMTNRAALELRRLRRSAVAESAQRRTPRLPLARQVFQQLVKHRHCIRVSGVERRRLAHLDEKCRLGRQRQAPHNGVRA
jgi:hypothetical protein